MTSIVACAFIVSKEDGGLLSITGIIKSPKGLQYFFAILFNIFIAMTFVPIIVIKEPYSIVIVTALLIIILGDNNLSRFKKLSRFIKAFKGN